MSQKKDEGLSQTDDMTLAEQVAGARALARLTRLVAQLIIEIGKLIKTYRSAASLPVTEIDAG
jgi:hypothetical protein